MRREAHGTDARDLAPRRGGGRLTNEPRIRASGIRASGIKAAWSHAARIATAWLIASPGLAGCEGLGRPIVDERPVPDAGMPPSCAVHPQCVPVREVPEGAFDVPAEAPPFAPPADCDGDRVDDALDTCPGLPNPDQRVGACQRAIDDCARLQRGELDLAGADLRGCVADAPITLMGDLDLTGAQLACASIALRADAPARVLLDEAVAAHAWLRAEGPITLSIRRTTADASWISLAWGARAAVEDAILRDSGLWLDPRTEVALDEEPGPAIAVVGSSLERVTLYEAASERAARARIDASSVIASRASLPALEVLGSTVVGSRLAAEALSLFDAELTASAVRGDLVTLASARLFDVVFDRCVDVRATDAELVDVDVPACPPGGLRAVRARLEACRLGGGVGLREGELVSSVIYGAGPESAFASNDTTLDGVSFCDDVGAGRIVGGELRCVGCGPAAFQGGAAVCVSNAQITERGCAAIELAPSCE